MSKNIEKVLLSLIHKDISMEEAVTFINQLFQSPEKKVILPEVISCEKIKPNDALVLLKQLREKNSSFALVKASEDIFNYVRLNIADIFYYDEGATIFSKPPGIIEKLNQKLVIASNHSFAISLLEEAYIVARMAGIESYKIKDIGDFGSNLNEMDMKIINNAEFIIYIASFMDSTIEWLAKEVDIPIILVPVLSAESPFVEQLNMLSSTLSYRQFKILRSSLNGAAQAAQIASYLMLKDLI